MDKQTEVKSDFLCLLNETLNLSNYPGRICEGEPLSPVILNSQPLNSSTVKSKKFFNLEQSYHDKTEDNLSYLDTNKTWTESTPSRQSSGSIDRFNVSPIVLNEKPIIEDIPSTLEPLLDSHNLEWTSSLASPFVAHKSSDSLLKTSEKQISNPSSDTKFVLSTNSSNLCDFESSTHDSRKTLSSFKLDTEIFSSKEEGKSSYRSKVGSAQNSLNGSLVVSERLEVEEKLIKKCDESSCILFENSIPLNAISTEDVKESKINSSPLPFQRTDRSKIEEKKWSKNRGTPNIVKCLFQDTKIVGDCEEMKTDCIMKKNLAPASNFSQLCQDSKTQDISVNTLEQICQVSELEFDSPPSPELMNHTSKTRKHRKQQQKVFEIESSESKDSLKPVLDVSDQPISLSDTSPLQSNTKIKSVESTEDAAQFIIPSAPLTKSLTSGIKSVEKVKDVRVEKDILCSKSDRKQLIYFINDLCTQVMSVAFGSDSILKDAVSFEEDPSFKEKNNERKKSSQDSNSARRFVQFSCISDSILTQNDKLDPGSHSFIPQDKFVISKSTDSQETETFKNTASCSKRSSKGASVGSDGKAINELNGSDQDLYTISDTQMFQIGETLENMEGFKSDLNFSFDVSLNNFTPFTMEKIDHHVNEKLDPTCSKKVAVEELGLKISGGELKEEKLSREEAEKYLNETEGVVILPERQTSICEIDSLNKVINTRHHGERDEILTAKVNSLNRHSVEEHKMECLLEDETKNLLVSSHFNSKCDNVLSTIEQKSSVRNPNFQTDHGRKVSVRETVLDSSKKNFSSTTIRADVTAANGNTKSSSLKEPKNSDSTKASEGFNGSNNAVDKKAFINVSSSNKKMCISNGQNVAVSDKESINSINIYDSSEESILLKTSHVNSTVGFSTARGNKVSISNKALEEAKKQFFSCDENYHGRSTTSESSNTNRFSTAKGQKALISDEALEEARKLLESSCDSPPFEATIGSPCVSNLKFSTASGKEISVSDEALNEANRLFDNCDDNIFPLKPSTISPKSKLKFNDIKFSTASGKEVSISDKALKEAKKFFDNCEDNPVLLKPSTISPRSKLKFNDVKFSTASGKEVSVSDKALKEAKRFFDNCDDNTEPLKPSTVSPKSKLILNDVKFSTSSEKDVSVSDKDLKEAKRFFDNCNDNTEPLKPSTVSPKSKLKFNDVKFSTASGKDVSVSDEALKEAKKFFDNCDDNTVPLKPSIISPKNNLKFSDIKFSTASGKDVSVSDKALKEAKKFFDNCDDNTEPLKPSIISPKNNLKFSDIKFSTASGKEVSVSDKALKEAKRFFDNSDDNTVSLKSSTISPKSKFKFNDVKFSTASGKEVSVSDKALKETKKFFDNCDENTIQLKPSTISPKSNLKFSNITFSTASGKEVSVSDKALKEAKKLFDNCSDNTVPLKPSIISPKNNLKFSDIKFSTASGKEVSVSDKALKEAKKFFDNCDENTVELKPSTISPKSTLKFSFPNAICSSKSVFSDIGPNDMEILAANREASPILNTVLNEVKTSLENDLGIAPTLTSSNASTNNVGFSAVKNNKMIFSAKASEGVKNVSIKSNDYIPTRVLKRFIHRNVEGPDDRKGSRVVSDMSIISEPSNAAFSKSEFLNAHISKALTQEVVSSGMKKQSDRFDSPTPLRSTTSFNGDIENVLTTSRKISSSDKVLLEVNKSFESADDIPLKGSDNESNSNVGFFSARRKKIPVSKKALEEAKKWFSSCNDSSPFLAPASTSCSNVELSHVSEKKVCISDEDLIKAKEVFGTEDIDIPIAGTSETRNCNVGFSTASGKKVQVSSKALKEAKKLFESNDVKIFSDVCEKNEEIPSVSRNITTVQNDVFKASKESFNSCISNNSREVGFNVPHSNVGFSTASGQKVFISDSALSEAKKLFESSDNIIPTITDTKFPDSNQGFSTARGRKLPVTEVALIEAKKNFDSYGDNDLEKDPVVSINSSIRFSASNKMNNSQPISTIKEMKKLPSYFDDIPSLLGPASDNKLTVHMSCELIRNSDKNVSHKAKEESVSVKPLNEAKNILNSSNSNKLKTFDCVVTDDNNLDTLKTVNGATCISNADVETNVRSKKLFSKDIIDHKNSFNQTLQEDSSQHQNLMLLNCSERSSVKSQKEYFNSKEIIGDTSDSVVSKLKNNQGKSIILSKQPLSTKEVTQVLSESGKENLSENSTLKDFGSSSNCSTTFAGPLKDPNCSKDNTNLCNSVNRSILVSNRIPPSRSSNKKEVAVKADPDVTQKDVEKRLNEREEIPKSTDQISCDMSPSVFLEVSESTAALLVDEENSECDTYWSSIPHRSSDLTNQISSIESYFSSNINNEEDGSTSPILSVSRRFKRRHKQGSLSRKRKISNLSETDYQDSPISTKKQASAERILKQNANDSIAELPSIVSFKKGAIFNSTPKLEFSKKRERDQDVYPGFSKRLKKLNCDSEKNILDCEIILKRKEAGEEQKRIIKNRSQLRKRIKSAGSYLTRKLAGGRISLKQAVLGQWPKMYSIEELLSWGVDEETIYVTSRNALDFRFSAWSHYSEEVCKENIDGIEVGDGVKIILDEKGFAGILEIKRGFLCSSQIDSSIVPDNWIENHFKWIVWKLACMEQRFPQLYANRYLTLENLVLQLKYRYDREIEHTQRPALKKILERDEAASKRMILCVANIIQANGSIELELTDGWYGAKAVVDAAMLSFISCKKVRVGTKLMIQGAELLNCDQGCDPLEMKADVRLKIHSNCTRRVLWDTKLGFFHDPGPFLIHLNSVLPDGGVIGKLNLVVVRVYPMLYLSKNAEGKKMMINEKLESLNRQLAEKKRASRVEKVYNEVKQELKMKKSRQRNMRWNSLSKKSVSLISSDQELFDYMESVADPSSVQLSDDQIFLLSKYKQREEEKMMQEIHSRVEQRLKTDEVSEETSVPLMKVRVIEGNDLKPSATLTIWRPSEEVLLMLKEGYRLNIYNVLPSKSRFGDINLSANFHTQYEIVSKDTDRSIARSISSFTCIKNPIFGEIDVVGVVIHVETMPVGKKCFQKVYLSDANDNFLAVSFYNGPAAFGWSDVIRKNAILACCNLQWSGGKLSMKIPSLFCSDISVFTEKPRMKHVESALSLLKNDPKLKNIQSFVAAEEKKLLETLENHSSANTLISGSTSTTDLSVDELMDGTLMSDELLETIEKEYLESSKNLCKSVDMPTSSHKKLNKLQIYGEAPPLPKLNISFRSSSLRKEFKVPSKMNESSNL